MKYKLIVPLILLIAQGASANPLTCEELFGSRPRVSLNVGISSTQAHLGHALYKFTAQRLADEFGVVLHPDFERIFHRFLYEPQSLTQNDLAYFKAYFELNHLTVTNQELKAEKLLQKELPQSQLVALRAARVLDRDVRLFDGTEFQQHPRVFYERKRRFLELFGFTRDEIERLSEAQLLTDRMLADNRFSYLASMRSRDEIVTPDMIKSLNRKIIATAKRYVNPNRGKSGLKTEIDETLANKIFNVVAYNSVTRVSSLLRYDPKGQFGFCFGRAMAIHKVAENQGVDPLSIRKAFVVGPMRGKFGAGWQFHVASIIDRKGGGFWVLDPFVGKPVTLEEWYEHHEAVSKDKRLRLFIADADRFGADGFAGYDLETLMKGYNNYFADMMRNLEDNDYDVETNRNAFRKAIDGVLNILNIGI